MAISLPTAEAVRAGRPRPARPSGWPRLVAYATILGTLVRLTYVLADNFPLNDGGMFYAMTRDLIAAGGALPPTTSYNQAGIPFTYPPLGFYLAAALDVWFHLSLLDVLRFVPLVASALTIVAFAPLARSILPSRYAAAIALFAFALHPRVFTWEIMGGGLTRSIGLLFAVLAIGRIQAMYCHARRRDAVLAGLFSGLALLSHLEMALFIVVSAAVLFLTYGRDWPGLTASLVVAALTILVIAPWLVFSLHAHGIGPYLAALDDGVPLYFGPLLLLMLHISDEPFFPVLGSLALLGIGRSLARREWMVPAWLVALFLIDARVAPTTAIIPLALLAGLGAELIGRWRIEGWVMGEDPSCFPPTRVPRSSSDRPPRVGYLIVAGLLVYATAAALIGERDMLVGVSPDERAAMSWVAANTPIQSQFLVITGESWVVSRTEEWFPVLAERRSVATVQGTEWLSGHHFARNLAADTTLRACANRDAACLRSWASANHASFDYLFVVKRPATDAGLDSYVTAPIEACCDGLLTSLKTDPRVRLVYDGPGAAIYQYRLTQRG